MVNAKEAQEEPEATSDARVVDVDELMERLNRDSIQKAVEEAAMDTAKERSMTRCVGMDESSSRRDTTETTTTLDESCNSHPDKIPLGEPNPRYLDYVLDGPDSEMSRPNKTSSCENHPRYLDYVLDGNDPEEGDTPHREHTSVASAILNGPSSQNGAARAPAIADEEYIMPGAFLFERGTFMTANQANADNADDFDWEAYRRQQAVANDRNSDPNAQDADAGLVTANPVQETVLPRAEPDSSGLQRQEEKTNPFRIC